MTEFKVVMKKGKPYLKMVCGSYETDMMIYGKDTDAPYVKYCSGFLGKTYLDEKMKAELNRLLAA